MAEAFRSLTLIVALLLPAWGHAQLFRAYLASDGLDTNPCTLPQPCRLLPAALAAVASGGEIWMLDSANYNTASVVVGKSVSILAIPGALGSIVATSDPAIQILAPGLKVSLRNLVVAPLPGTGSIGILLTAASSLKIDGCVVAGMASDGIYVSASGKLVVVDSVIRDNNGYALSATNGGTASIARTKIVDNNSGVVAYNSGAFVTKVAVSDSFILGGLVGALAWNTADGANAQVVVTRSTVERTQRAFHSLTDTASPAEVTVSYSMATDNDYSWMLIGVGAVMRTLGNNHFSAANAPVGIPTSAPLQ